MFMSEPHFDAKHKSDTTKKHASQINHLNLTGALTMEPEYRSQFVTYPIEKSQSVPQISNIQFNGKFGGVAEYRDSFREYDHYAKIDPIRNPDHLTVQGAVMGGDGGVTAEYTDRFKAPDHRALEKQVSAKKSDLFRLQGHEERRPAEYNDRFRDPKIRTLPQRGKPRSDIMAMDGEMDYTPEYR